MANRRKGYEVRAQARAAKIVSTGELCHDTTPTSRRVQAQILTDIAEPVSGMNQLQSSYDSGVVAQSMQYAISYLRNQSNAPEIIHTPAPNNIDWFHHENHDKFLNETSDLDIHIEKDDNEAYKVHIHSVFKRMRSRETSVWMIRVGPAAFDESRDDRTAHWCMIVANFIERDAIVVQRGKLFHWDRTVDCEFHRYFDRELLDVQLFNPLQGSHAERQETHERLAAIFQTTCARAGIATKWQQFFEHLPGYQKVESHWQTGYQVYGIAQQYFHRLARLGDMREHDRSIKFWSQTMWSDYTGLMNIDACREAMIVACAARAIAMSGHQARLAIELPGKKARHPAEKPKPNARRLDSHLDDPEEVIGTEHIAVHLYF